MDEEMNKQIPLGHEGFILSYEPDCPHCGYIIACGEPQEPEYDFNCHCCYERYMHYMILEENRKAYEVMYGEEDDSF